MTSSSMAEGRNLLSKIHNYRLHRQWNQHERRSLFPNQTSSASVLLRRRKEMMAEKDWVFPRLLIPPFGKTSYTVDYKASDTALDVIGF